MNKAKRLLAVFLLLMAFIIFLLTYKYLKIKYNISIPCIIHEITGLFCPGCGITRAIFALLELDIKKAIKYNILIIIIFPFIIIYIINCLYIFINNLKKDPSKIFPKILWYFLLIITIVFGIIRNINYFSWLQPI